MSRSKIWKVGRLACILCIYFFTIMNRGSITQALTPIQRKEPLPYFSVSVLIFVQAAHVSEWTLLFCLSADGCAGSPCSWMDVSFLSQRWSVCRQPMLLNGHALAIWIHLHSLVWQIHRGEYVDPNVEPEQPRPPSLRTCQTELCGWVHTADVCSITNMGCLHIK